LNGSSTISLNTSNFNAGVYMVNLTVNGETMVKRLVIE
jgi:PKD repeat protein